MEVNITPKVVDISFVIDSTFDSDSRFRRPSKQPRGVNKQQRQSRIKGTTL